MNMRLLMRRRYRGVRVLILTTVLMVGYLGLMLPAVIWNSYPSDLIDIVETHSLRKLLDTNSSSSSGGSSGQYPPDVFSIEQRRKGAVVLHIFGMIYMLVGLAIVCDEFFVPALSVIIELLKISEDVAGATFMAAGGSAPELFASLIGLFFAHNNVGIGTIVGSAVFNILFVIGMCAIVSKKVLHLTWWPLFRDVTFYSISLILLIAFFTDKFIKWYEALALFSCYILYVLFMKFNARIEVFVKTKILRQKNRVHNNDSLLNQRPNRSCSIPILHSGTNHFRHGVLQLMIHTIDPISEDKPHEKAMKLHAMTSKKDLLSGNSAETPSPVKNGDVHNKTQSRNSDSSDRNKQMHVQAISNGHVPNDSYFTYGVQREASQSSKDSPLRQVQCSSSARTSNNTEITSLESPELSKSTSGIATPGQVNASIDTSHGQTENNNKELLEEDEPLDMSWPSTWRKRITYVLVAPLVFPMWLTLPDTRRPEKKKWYLVTFAGSITWIAIFSYLLVWWANQTGETMSIPSEVMGLTILAAGTSIPDFITSVIVAKKGFGDMAVSSSVGSNIFDITVGLPVPWLIYSAIYLGEPVNVDSNGLVCSIVLLFGMLLAVIITIAAAKWKMTKIMGGSMLGLYVVFLVLSVLLELRVVVCPVNS